jgi:serine/threonine protein kinase
MLRNSKELPGNKATYRVTKTLTPGKFGQTFFATVTSVNTSSSILSIGQEVVLKLPRLPNDIPLQDVDRKLGDLQVAVTKELQCLARLRDVRHVAHVLDRGNCKIPFKHQRFEVLFLVQQRAPGDTLDCYLKALFTQQKMNSQRFLDIASKLAITLRDIHRAQVIHGDIWFKNIMCDDAANITYIDFGQGFLRDMLLGDAPAIGNHRFLPPERGRSDSGDLYGLGLALFYVATGHQLPPYLANEPAKYLRDDDELKSTIVASIKEHNEDLYVENCGVADIIARCLRYDVHHRVLSADRLLEEIEAFSPAAPKAFVFKRLEQQLGHLEKSSNALFARIARQQAKRLQAIVTDMRRGIFDLTGGHEDIVSGMSEYLSFLSKDDQYLTISQPLFWATRNLGIMGRFLSQNVLAATRGATVRRVFLITPEDEKDPEFWRIIQAQLNAVEALDSMKINTKNRDLGLGGYWVGYHRVSTVDRDRLIHEGRHYGILSKGGRDTVAIVTYNPDGQIVAVRFRAGRAIFEDQRTHFDVLLNCALPLNDYRGSSSAGTSI